MPPSAPSEENKSHSSPNTIQETPTNPLPGQVIAPTPVQTEKPKSKRGLIIVTILVVLLLGGGASAWALTRKNNKTQLQNTTSNQPQTNTSAPVSKTYKVAYIFNTKLWVADANGQNAKEISKSNSLGDIKALYAWSPDNKVVLAKAAADTTKPSKKNQYLLIDVQNGSATKLKFSDDIDDTREPEDLDSNFAWTSNKTLVYISDNDKIHQVDPSTGNKTLGTLPKHDFSMLTAKSVSADGQHVIYGGHYSARQAPRFSGKIYVYNIQTKTEKLVTDKATAPLGWNGKNIAYIKDKRVYIYDLQTGKEQAGANLISDSINTSADSVSNPSIFAYSYFSDTDSRNYLQIINAATKKVIYSNKLNSAATIALGGFTEDNKYFAYTENDYPGSNLNQKANTLNMDTKKVHQLCNGGYIKGKFVGYCQSPVFSN